MAEDFGLGKCTICGKRAVAVYPLLPHGPRFCHEHHNPRDAGPFGADFSGPDDFDIPLPPMEFPRDYYVKPLREKFTWTTKDGVKYLLKDLTDNHLQNIIDYLKKRLKELPELDWDPTDQEVRSTEAEEEHLNQVIELLKKEQKYRKRHHIKIGLTMKVWND